MYNRITPDVTDQERSASTLCLSVSVKERSKEDAGVVARLDPRSTRNQRGRTVFRANQACLNCSNPHRTSNTFVDLRCNNVRVLECGIFIQRHSWRLSFTVHINFTYDNAQPMFGRATITLGIGPHSRLFLLPFFVWFRAAISTRQLLGAR